jgi:hypothetical protein
MTIGDVQGTIAMIAGTSGALWASQLATAAIFSQKTHRAAEQIERNPGKSFRAGLGLAVTAGVVGFILVNQPNGVLKLVGWVMLAGLFALALIGSAGLATLVAGRLRNMDPKLSHLGAVGRGAAFLIAAGLLPFLGTFLLFPAMLCFSLGGGLRAVRDKSASVTEIDPILPTAQFATNAIWPARTAGTVEPTVTQPGITPSENAINQNIGR